MPGVKYNERGEEIPDTTPVEIPVGFGAPETTEEMIRRMIHGVLSDDARSRGAETFEEANDFDIPDEEWEDLTTQHEILSMGEEFPDAEEAQAEPVGEDEKGGRGKAGAPGPGVPGETAEPVPGGAPSKAKA